MYITYPRFLPERLAGITQHADVLGPLGAMEVTEPAPAFLHFVSAAQSLVELAFIGERLEFDVMSAHAQLSVSGTDTERGRRKLLLLIMFVGFYLVYVVMSLVLLLNLLIAMMGDTYAEAKQNATRWYRVNYARHVLRLELQLLVFWRWGLVTLNCGEKIGTGADVTWVHNYRNYKPNAEGGGTRGAKPSMFEEEVEKVAGMDEQDDDMLQGDLENLVSSASIAPLPLGAQQHSWAVGKAAVAVTILGRADADADNAQSPDAHSHTALLPGRQQGSLRTPMRACAPDAMVLSAQSAGEEVEIIEM